MQMDAKAPTQSNRVVTSRVDPVPTEDENDRRAVVTFFLYEDNTALSRVVDLKTGRVLDEVRVPGAMAPVAEVEIEYARSLLRENKQVGDLIAPFRGQIIFSFGLTSIPDSAHPFYGKRVLAVRARTPEGYVSELPRIYVNLTDGEVVINP
jgi:hypothetical protein